MLLSIALLVVGFVVLIKGADFLVEGSSSLAKRFNISPLVIGLTLVSFGTSAPELVINLFASFSGSSDIAIGNILGSNIANILLVLGVAAAIRPLPIQKSTVLSEIPFSFIAILLVGFLVNSTVFESTKEMSKLTRLDGSVLLFFFLLFLAYIYKMARENNDEPDEIPDMSVGKATLMSIGGVLALFIGGKLSVDSAVEIGQLLGLSEAFIGLTIMAIGTSLPELVTSAVAAYKGNADLAVGNVVGSNIFNILWILGLSSIILPLPFNADNNLDVAIVVIASTMIIFAVSLGKKYVIERWSGVIFVAAYIAYIWSLFYR